MGSILIHNASILTINDRHDVINRGYLFIENEFITEIGNGEPAANLVTIADHMIDASQMVVMPGMVNAHTHLFQSFIRGLADDQPLLDWLKNTIWPISSALTSKEVYLAAMVGLLENIRGGATSIIDHHYIHTDLANGDSICQAASEIGVRLLLARGWTDINYHDAFMESPEQIISETSRLHEKWMKDDCDLIHIGFGPLIPWGCSDESMLSTDKLSQQWNTFTHIHVAETQEEVRTSLEKHGKRHIEWLHHLGILTSQTHLVHSVWLDDHELDLISKHNSVVIHCPVSNMYLASGVARVPEMIDKGIKVALATDGPGSNNNQDMLEVLKTTVLLHKVNSLNASVFSPKDILWMACRGGAEAFGMADQIGSLEVGKKADLIIVDLDSPMMMPVHSVESALVYNASNGDVDTVIVNGKILMHRKEILFTNEKRILSQAREACKSLFRRAGIADNSGTLKTKRVAR